MLQPQETTQSVRFIGKLTSMIQQVQLPFSMGKALCDATVAVLTTARKEVITEIAAHSQPDTDKVILLQKAKAAIDRADASIISPLTPLITSFIEVLDSYQRLADELEHPDENSELSAVRGKVADRERYFQLAWDNYLELREEVLIFGLGQAQTINSKLSAHGDAQISQLKKIMFYLQKILLPNDPYRWALDEAMKQATDASESLFAFSAALVDVEFTSSKRDLAKEYTEKEAAFDPQFVSQTDRLATIRKLGVSLQAMGEHVRTDATASADAAKERKAHAEQVAFDKLPSYTKFWIRTKTRLQQFKFPSPSQARTFAWPKFLSFSFFRKTKPSPVSSAVPVQDRKDAHLMSDEDLTAKLSAFCGHHYKDQQFHQLMAKLDYHYDKEVTEKLNFLFEAIAEDTAAHLNEFDSPMKLKKDPLFKFIQGKDAKLAGHFERACEKRLEAKSQAAARETAKFSVKIKKTYNSAQKKLQQSMPSFSRTDKSESAGVSA